MRRRRRRFVRRKMDRPQSVRLRALSRRNAAVRARPRRAHVLRADRERVAVRAARRGSNLSRRARARLSREQGASHAQDRGGRQEESAAVARARAGGSDSGVARDVAGLRLAASKRIAPCTRRTRRKKQKTRARTVHICASFSPWRRRRSCGARSASATTTRRRCACRRTCSTSSKRMLPFALTGAQRRVDSRNLGRYGARRPDEPTAARRRRQRQDAGCGGGGRAGGAQRHAVGA